MIVSLKDGFKLIGISIMACCAVCVCNMFLNFQIDLRSIANQVEAGPAQALYDAFVNTSIVCCACCGGCMLITSVVMLFFYIKHYIDSHSREIGILKAHGYSNFRISRGFAIFAISIFVGCLMGYLLSFAIMPMFYQKQNDNDLLPHIPMNIHWIMIVSLKDGFKLIGISIMACCAVCVCNMFLNFQIDLRSIANLVEAGPAQALYDAFVNTSIVC